MRLHRSLVLGSLLSAVTATPAFALIVGALPDSPAAHVDPNTASSPWAGVGSVTIGGSTFTGTLIAPGYVLTAGHVAYGVAASTITFNLNVGGDLTQTVTAAAVYTAPGFSGFNPSNPAGDLAIIQLTQPVTSAPSYQIYRGDLAAGSTLTFVGYGNSGSGSNGVNGAVIPASPSVKRTGQNNADYFVRDQDGRKAIYYYDFDGPGGQTNYLGGGSLGNGKEVTVGTGDSGSPAFYTDASGKLWLAGVNTFSAAFVADQVSGTFGTGGGGMVLSDYSAWIDSVVATPVPEPANWVSLLVGLGCLGALRRFPQITASC